MKRWAASLVASLATLLSAAGFSQAAAHDWPVFGSNIAHSSAPTFNTGITAAKLATMKRQQVTLDGVADSSPIYLHAAQVKGAPHDTFFLTTSYGKTLAIDASDGSTLWEFTPPNYATWAGTRQITNASPVADDNRDAIYAAVPDGTIVKLAVADGRVLWTTVITKLPVREKLPSPLVAFHGHVIATTDGYIGDRPPYQGHVAILDAATGKLLHVWNALCSDRTGLLDPPSCPDSDAGIWGRAGAVLDPQGDIYIATGNATWDGVHNWGDSTIELDPDATRILGNYTPSNTEELNARDLDIGSSSPMLLGNGLVLQGGKDGLIRLLDWKTMAGVAPHRGGDLQDVATPGRTDLFTSPAIANSGGATWVFAADNAGTAAWTLEGDKLVAKWNNQNEGTSPVLAGGLLYIYGQRTGGLRVYQPGTGELVATLPCGTGHWNSPIVVDGRIALPEGSANSRPAATGVLDIWKVAGME